MTSSQTDTETMIAIGQGLYGDRWIPRLADALGPFHPRQRSVSASYISAIASGRKPFPEWIRDALPQAISYEIWVRKEFRRIADEAYSAASDRRESTDGTSSNLGSDASC